MDMQEMTYLKKELHRRFGHKTVYNFTECVKIINDLFEQIETGIKAATPQDPTAKAMEASNEQFEELKKEAGIDKPRGRPRKVKV